MLQTKSFKEGDPIIITFIGNTHTKSTMIGDFRTYSFNHIIIVSKSGRKYKIALEKVISIGEYNE